MNYDLLLSRKLASETPIQRLERQLQEARERTRRDEVVVRMFVLVKQNLEFIPIDDPVWDTFYRFLKDVNELEWGTKGETWIHEIHKATKHQIGLLLSRQKSREKKIQDSQKLKEAHGFTSDFRKNGEVLDRIARNPWKDQKK